MKEAFEQAALRILEGDLAGLEQTLRTPGLATYRAPQGHPTLLQLVACEAEQLPDPVGATKVLLAAGAEPHGPLVAAAGCNSPTVVEEILASGAAVDGVGEWTPLDEALYWNQAAMAQSLVDRGASTGRLRRVAGLGCAEAIDEFFDGSTLSAAAGPLDSPFADTFSVAQANDPAHVLNHAFVMAVNSGQQATANLLLDRGAAVNSTPPGFHWRGTALHAAIWRGDAGLVEWLLNKGADPTIRDGFVQSDALGWARHHEHDHLIELLS